MNCANCGTENRSDRKFCRECGTSLSPPCPTCGATNDPGDKFCGNCGGSLVEIGPAIAPAPTAIEQPDAPASAERRFVSALFADLVGFTPFSEGRDPEDVRAMLTTYFDRSRDIIERFGGVVDKFIGDAVTAFWGATQAQEDDAERAVRAGLELVEMVGDLGAEIGASDLALRAGILTGETSVGPGGNEKGLVVGDIVNTAARLQSIAAPGSVAVGESTYNLVRSAIDFEVLGTQDLKGKAEGVPAWRALRIAAERGGGGRAEGLEPPFVGRHEEIRLLKDQLHAAGREGRSRLISIVGQGGIGKSRLIWEFQKYVDGLVDDIYWHQGRSPAYGDGLTFWALGEMVKRRAGIAETDEDLRSRTKLHDSIAEYVSDAEDQAWIEPRMAALLGLGDSPGGDKAELYAAWRSFFQHVSERGTTVLVFEDLHWADAGLLEFVEELVERSTSQPILVVTLARPELLERRPDWGSGRTNFLSLHLGPLTGDEMHDLVAGAVPGMPEAPVDLIAERAAGVPLYAVELIRMLVTEGDLVLEDGTYRLVGEVEELAVPDSLNSAIGARLDRLSAEDRTLLQDAAVLGQVFTPEGLVAMRGESVEELQESLSHLVRKELLGLESDPRSPERGQYYFVQSLIREVASRRLNRDERRMRHLAVAHYFESLDEIELAGVVASHYLDAYEATPAGEGADDLAARALAALRNAAERAAALHSHEQAISLAEQAAELAIDASERGILWELAATSANRLFQPERAEELAQRAIEAQQEAEDAVGLLRATRTLARIYNDTNQPERAVDVLAPLAEGRDPEEDPGLASAAAELARGYMLASRGTDAVEASGLALVAAEYFDDINVVVEAMITKGTALGSMGRPREGMALLRGAIELVEDYQITESEKRAYNNLSYLLTSDSPIEANAASSERLDRARRSGDLLFLASVQFDVVQESTWRADFDRADEVMAEIDLEAVPDLQRVGLELVLLWQESMTGRHVDRDASEKLLEKIEDTADPQVRLWIHDIRGTLAMHAGQAEESYDVFLKMDDVNTAQRDVYGMMRAALFLGDEVRLRETRDRLTTRARGGRYIDAIRKTIEAGIAVLDGRAGDGLAVLRKALELFDEVSRSLDGAFVRAVFARMLGPQHAEFERLVGSARDTFASLAVTTYLDLFADVLSEHEQAATAS